MTTSITYNRNQARKAAEFIINNNHYARKYSVFQLMEILEEHMWYCVKHDQDYSGTMGFLVMWDDTDEDENGNRTCSFSVMVDPSVGTRDDDEYVTIHRIYK